MTTQEKMEERKSKKIHALLKELLKYAEAGAFTSAHLGKIEEVRQAVFRHC